MRQLTPCLIFAVLLAGCDSPTQPGAYLATLGTDIVNLNDSALNGPAFS